MSRTLDRYRDVIPDWDAFLDAGARPEPVTLRVRRGLVDRGELRDRLEGRGFRLQPVPGLPDYLTVTDGPGSVAQTLEHWLGLFHVQQSVMALPSLALAPAPGERVLDLCAAPGGKTVHLAQLMEDRGPLLAVDPKEKRLRGLMANVFRLGHTNVVVVAADGRELPGGAAFDRVLVDVPCSAEGNVRRHGGSLPERRPGFQEYVTSLQESLLRRAIELTRPGGRVLYSTCTFAPEENEAVVDRVLGSPPAPVEMEAIELQLPHEPGLTEWQGRRFRPALSLAWRVYPHHMDSGGLFMARLRRSDGAGPAAAAGSAAAGSAAPAAADAPAKADPAASPDPPAGTAPRRDTGWSTIPCAFPGDDEAAARKRIDRAVNILESEYGFVYSVLRDLGWMVRNENIWAQTAGEWPLAAWQATEGWRTVAAGLRALRAAGPGKETPTNQFLSRFHGALGDGRRRAVTDAELRVLLEGGSLDPGELPAGPVVLYHEGILLGRGMVGRAGLRSEIPSAKARRLAVVLGL